MATLVERWMSKWRDCLENHQKRKTLIFSEETLKDRFTKIAGERMQYASPYIAKKLHTASLSNHLLTEQQIMQILQQHDFSSVLGSGVESEVKLSYKRMSDFYLMCNDQFAQEDRADRREKGRLWWFRMGTALGFSAVLLGLGWVTQEFDLSLPIIRMQGTPPIRVIQAAPVLPKECAAPIQWNIGAPNFRFYLQS